MGEIYGIIPGVGDTFFRDPQAFGESAVATSFARDSELVEERMSRLRPEAVPALPIASTSANGEVFVAIQVYQNLIPLFL